MTVVIVAVAVKTTVTTYDKVISKKWRKRERVRERLIRVEKADNCLLACTARSCSPVWDRI